MIRKRDPPLATICEALGRVTKVECVPIPRDCRDGFVEAFYARPESYLDPAVRRSRSPWAFLETGCEQRIVARLRADLESGAWDARFGRWRTLRLFEGSLRLIVSQRDATWQCADASDGRARANRASSIGRRKCPSPPST